MVGKLAKLGSSYLDLAKELHRTFPQAPVKTSICAPVCRGDREQLVGACCFGYYMTSPAIGPPAFFLEGPKNAVVVAICVMKSLVTAARIVKLLHSLHENCICFADVVCASSIGCSSWGRCGQRCCDVTVHLEIHHVQYHMM